MGLSEHLNIKSLPAHFSITKVIWMIAPRRIHISACYFFNHKVICFYRLPFAVFASQRFKRRFLHLAADRQPVVTERALWFLRIILAATKILNAKKNFTNVQGSDQNSRNNMMLFNNKKDKRHDVIKQEHFGLPGGA